MIFVRPIEVVVSLVMVTVCDGLVVPTLTAPYAREVGLSFSAVPVPVRLTVWGLPGALSLNDKVPVRVPCAVGVNVTLTVHFLPTSNVAPQVVFEIAKSPLALVLAILSVAVPALVSVTFFAALVVPTGVFAKVREVGVKLTSAPFTVTVSFKPAT